ncbi:hypothetical protein JKP88DRAFT_241042 [Tribonema minus]|uniref:Uncharacterized protein n=1 Tax=Tribonema minus TaxID=303371 RepID=A0A835Z3P1_9STRA|nr:hypothetical protein JKP88DRAFT_241042 [Tribonema minus]
MSKTLQELLHMVDRRTRVWLAVCGDALENAESICSTYSNEGYTCMNQDAVRNSFFQKTIEYTQGRNWLEIGPGAHALLTQMALRKPTLHSLVAVEANEQSALEARKCVKHDSRCRIITGYSTTYAGEKCVDVVLSEIIGVIASSEGVIGVMNDLRMRRYATQSTAMIPARAATFIAPVQLGSIDICRGGNVYASERILLLRGMRVDSANLANDVGMLEDLHFDMLIADRLTHHSTLQIVKSGQCHGFGMFVGISSPMPCRRYTRSKIATVEKWHANDMWTTSDASDHHYSRNWRNPVALLSTPLAVCVGDVLNLICIVDHATTSAPVYSICYSLNGNPMGQLTLTHTDMYPTFQLLQAEMKYDRSYSNMTIPVKQQP